MLRRGRPRGVMVVFGTMALAIGLLAAPGATLGSAPVAAVDFVDAWTNDDGSVDNGDVTDTGDPSPEYDAWEVISSGDPYAPFVESSRWDKDVAICTAEVRGSDPDVVDVTIENAYPGYVCTFTTVVENGAAVPIEVVPAVVLADAGLLVQPGEPQFPETLGGGEQALAVFSVTVLQSAPQNTTLHSAIIIRVATPPCNSTVVFGVERGTGHLYEIDPVAGTAALLADIADPAPSNINSPNGLAYDAANGRLYFSANNTPSDSVVFSDLYFWDGASVIHAGTVAGLPAGAEFKYGGYYYFINNTDDLHLVTFNPDGTIAGQTLLAGNVTGNTESLRFGDIVIDGSTMYGSTNGPAENFFSITGLGATNAYTEISAPQGSRLQLAFGDDGTLFGQATATGEFFIVDPGTGATTSLGVPTGASDGMTDLASAFCPDDWPPASTRSISFIRVWDDEPPIDVVPAMTGAVKIVADGFDVGGAQYSVEPPDARLGVPLVIDLGDGRTVAITDWIIDQEGEFLAFYYEVEGGGVWLDVKVGPEIYRLFVSGSGLWPS